MEWWIQQTSDAQRLWLQYIGSTFAGARSRLKMPVKKLSQITGISASHLLRIESGEFDFTITKLFVLSESLCVPISHLLEPLLFETRVLQEIPPFPPEEKELRALFQRDDKTYEKSLRILHYLVRVVAAIQFASSPVALVDSLENPIQESKARMRQYASRFDFESDSTKRLSTIISVVSRPFPQLRELDLIDGDLLKKFAGWAVKNHWFPDDTKFQYSMRPVSSNAPAQMELADADASSQKTGLTNQADALTHEGVKPVLPQLIQRLKHATEPHGKKSELAKWLGVHRQMVTDWLSQRQEPGGENTLRLLHWVERQERQK